MRASHLQRQLRRRPPRRSIAPGNGLSARQCALLIAATTRIRKTVRARTGTLWDQAGQVHDLEDDDHDAEADEEDRPVPWDDFDDRDEDVDEYDR